MNKKLLTKRIAVFVLLSSILLHPLSVYAFEKSDGSVAKDSIYTNTSNQADAHTSFKISQIFLPASLIAVGTFGVYNSGFKRVNNSVKDEMDKLCGTCYFHIDDYIQYLPVISYIGIDFIGFKSKHSLKERLIVGATAYISMASIVNMTKYSIKEPRPDSGAKNSFPSGHTATVFTGAELVREEYGLGPGIGAYTIAVGVAFLRLYNGRHWFNDVVAGAGIGILSARIGYWMLPLYQRWFKWNKSSFDNNMVVIPSYNHVERSIMINLSCSF